MKRADDPRHKKRVEAVQELFALSFNDRTKLSRLATKTQKCLTRADALIAASATEWPIERINRVDLAILRLSITELLTKKAPEKVIIDEAVELAKEFGSQKSSSFINGVLGNVLKKLSKKKDS